MNTLITQLLRNPGIRGEEVSASHPSEEEFAPWNG